MSETLFGPFLSHLFRISGLLPLYLKPDQTGFPNFSKFWCIYSFLIYITIGVFTAQISFETTDPILIGHYVTLHFFLVTTCVSSCIACKLGAFVKFIKNNAKFDEKWKVSAKSYKEILVLYTISIVCSLSLVAIVVETDCSREKYVFRIIFFTICTYLFFSCEMLPWILLCSIKRRLDILNCCVKDLESKTAWTVRKVEIMSTSQDVSVMLKIIANLNDLTMQNICIVKSSFGLQLLLNYNLLFCQSVLDSNIVQIDGLVYSLVEFLLWFMTLVLRMLLFSWITYCLSDNVQSIGRICTRMISIRMNSTVRQQIKTLRLKLSYQSLELFMVNFSVYSVENILLIFKSVAINVFQIYLLYLMKADTE